VPYRCVVLSAIESYGGPVERLTEWMPYAFTYFVRAMHRIVRPHRFMYVISGFRCMLKRFDSILASLRNLFNRRRSTPWSEEVPSLSLSFCSMYLCCEMPLVKPTRNSKALYP